MRDFHYGVYVGRFQPLHVGHQHVIAEALEKVETLIVAIGSADVASNPVNPFSFKERRAMFESVYRHEIVTGRMILIPVADHPDDADWAEGLYDAVNEAILEHGNKGGVVLHGLDDFKVALAGYGKDKSSFYLKLFPMWASIQIETQHGTINASDIRKEFFRRLPHLPTHAVDQNILAILHTFTLSEKFKSLVLEAEYYEDYPKTYGKGPFLTADALVRHRGKILLVTRGKTPGKGLLAMPGGFVNPDEMLYDAALRELSEEVGFDPWQFHAHYAGNLLADDPKRSLRGRVVSGVHFFDVEDDIELPEPVGADDAAHAGWYDFASLRPEQFFEDHFHLINDLLYGASE